MKADGIYMDVETDGLYGRAWAICAVEFREGVEVSRFERREDVVTFPITNEWVKENVLPHNLDIQISDDLYGDFAAWWNERKGRPVFAHMGSPVESGVFRTLVERGLIGAFDGPYPLHDVASMLIMKGEDPTSVDAYLTKHGIRPEGNAHDCRYDVDATISAVKHLLSSIS